MFKWGGAGQPGIWVAHEMVLEHYQLANVCNGLINAIATRLKVTSGQTTLTTTMKMWIAPVM